MASPAEPIAWEWLAPPPRRVPRAVRLRVRLNEFLKAIDLRSSTVGFFAVFFALVGFVLSFLGAVNLTGIVRKSQDGPFWRAIYLTFAISGPIILLATLTSLVAIVQVRANRMLRLLRAGSIASATITEIWNKQGFRWSAYEEITAEWRKLATAVSTYYHPWLSALTAQVRNWPCKIRVADSTGQCHEIEMRMDLEVQAKSPRVLVLCDPPNVNDAVATSEIHRGLTISPDGHWEISDSARFLAFLEAYLRSAVPVIGMYAATVLGLTFVSGHLPTALRMDASPLAAAAVVILLTATHAVAAVLLFRYMLDMLGAFQSGLAAGRQNKLVRAYLDAFRVLVWLFIGFWFGAPIAGLGYLTGWLSLIWAGLHWALAKAGTRAWVFVEYGSTSMALLLFVVGFSVERLFPLGIVVVFIQAGLLAILELAVRDKWLGRKIERAKA